MCVAELSSGSTFVLGFFYIIGVKKIKYKFFYSERCLNDKKWTEIKKKLHNTTISALEPWSQNC